jgi:hypothetical protein
LWVRRQLVLGQPVQRVLPGPLVLGRMQPGQRLSRSARWPAKTNGGLSFLVSSLFVSYLDLSNGSSKAHVDACAVNPD